MLANHLLWSFRLKDYWNQIHSAVIDDIKFIRIPCFFSEWMVQRYVWESELWWHLSLVLRVMSFLLAFSVFYPLTVLVIRRPHSLVTSTYRDKKTTSLRRYLVKNSQLRPLRIQEKKNKQKAKSNRGISRPLLHAKQLLIHANARSNKSLCNNKQANRLFLLASSWRKVSRVTSLATRTSLGRTRMLRVDGGAEIRTGV